MQQQHHLYTEEDHAVWQILYERQASNLRDKACRRYLNALETLKDVLPPAQVPRFSELNAVLRAASGWQIHVVPGLIPPLEFFDLLAERKFCSSTWLRKRHQLDYLEEPDMFHDIFGHVPLLMDPEYADFMQALGALAGRHRHDATMLEALERLYWFTIEFGVKRENGALRIYGAGILSSYGESQAIFEPETEIRAWNPEAILRQPFDKHTLQPYYYELPDWETLFALTEELETILCPTGS